MLPEERARIKIDEQLTDAGWEVVHRFEYNRKNPSAVTEASMRGRKESDYLLFIDNKAIAVVEAKRAESNLDEITSRRLYRQSARMVRFLVGRKQSTACVSCKWRKNSIQKYARCG